MMIMMMIILIIIIFSYAILWNNTHSVIALSDISTIVLLQNSSMFKQGT